MTARPLICLGAAALVAAASSCIGTTALQTASTVDPRSWRAGAQVSATPWCTVSLSPLNRCALAPAGLPLPEVRASVRTGLLPKTDAGLSLSGSAVLPQGISVGALLDAKRELWAHGDDHRRHLLSASIGLGGRLDLLGTFGTSPTGGIRTEPELSIPVAGWYGFQQGGWEWVASPRFVERVAFARLSPGALPSPLHSEWLGLTLAAISPGQHRLALGLDYLAPVADLASGPFTVSIGGLFDFGDGAAAPASDATP